MNYWESSMMTYAKIAVSALTILLLIIDGYCLTKMQRNVKRKNGKGVLKYCKIFFVISAVVCLLLFGYMFFDERSRHPEISLCLLIIKASWAVWVFTIAVIFAGKIFWKKGKLFENEENN